MNKTEDYNKRLEMLLKVDDKYSELNLEYFNLVVCCPDIGWIDTKMEIGDDSYFFSFSDTYPPFKDLIQWIESIIDGNPVEPIKIDCEYYELFFKISDTNIPDVLLVEFIKFNFPGTGVYRKSLINKSHFIEEFYLIFKYLMSIDYEYEEINGDAISFEFDRDTDDIIRFDLSTIEQYINKK